MAYVYIVRCRDGSYYTGAARDLAARILKHQAGKASRYTRARLPVKLVWSRQVRTWNAALREEHRIKGLRRRDKESLVASARTPGARAKVREPTGRQRHHAGGGPAKYVPARSMKCPRSSPGSVEQGPPLPNSTPSASVAKRSGQSKT